MQVTMPKIAICRAGKALAPLVLLINQPGGPKPCSALEHILCGQHRPGFHFPNAPASAALEHSLSKNWPREPS